jgi:hypothetical protein
MVGLTWRDAHCFLPEGIQHCCQRPNLASSVPAGVGTVGFFQLRSRARWVQPLTLRIENT